MDLDNQTIISDITESCELADNNTVSSAELVQKQEELRIKTELELNKLTIEGLKEKCKEQNIGGISKMKKPELVQALLAEFIKIFAVLKDKKVAELKSICKQHSLKCSIGTKKDEICLQILNYCSSTLKFKIDDQPIIEELTAKPKTKNVTETKKMSPMEELEKQRLEIDQKMKEELDKQKKIEEDERKQK